MNMKVKLILSFFVIVAINICFGLYSLYSLYIVNGRVVEANSWTDGISQLTDMQFGVISLRRDDLNYTLQTDDVQKKNTLLHRETSIKNAEEVMNAYKYDVETIPYDTEEQRQEDMNAINLIIDNWKAYLAVSQKLLDESDSNNETNVMALINGESQTSFEELENSVVDLVVYNQEGCAAVMVMSEEIYQKTVRVILGILLVIAVFSVTVPVLMVRGIRRSIGELLRVSKAIGEGDLTVTARIFANDEFGELAGRYNQMIAHIKSLVSHMQ
ncbi:MAG: MCP four helix bundle domain-containing protein, partial [Synergistaceae bacterium]|nr:MCP four helix bundle domain-containing protein [Synergistaceae bacterium]